MITLSQNTHIFYSKRGQGMREKESSIVKWHRFGIILTKRPSQAEAKWRSINCMVKIKTKKRSVRKWYGSMNYHVVTGLIKESNAIRH